MSHVLAFVQHKKATACTLLCHAYLLTGSRLPRIDDVFLSFFSLRTRKITAIQQVIPSKIRKKEDRNKTAVPSLFFCLFLLSSFFCQHG